MTANLKPYPEMRDSGVPWLGEVPAHWAVLPNRALFVEINERNHPGKQMLSVTINRGVIRQEALLTDSSKKDSSNQDKSAYKFVRPGDLVYNKMRACVFILDFINDTDTIQNAFADYYRTTILADETDPDKLHDLKSVLDGYEVYANAQIDELVGLYLGGADRDQLNPILDACVADYKEQLDEDGQVDFKGKAKAFLRTYGFLAQILPYTNAEWEKLSIFLNFLVPKLLAPVEEDLSKGILEAIDMDSYRVEKKATVRIQLPDSDAEIEPVPTSGGGRKSEPEIDRLSNIIKSFNDLFGNIPWTDEDRVHKLITEDVPNRVAADTAYQNAMKHSDKQNARIEHDKALGRVMTAILKDDTELFKYFMDNESFRKWMTDTIFGLTYEASDQEVLTG